MSVSSDAFLQSLAKSELKPVYMIAGAEPLLVLESADALRAHLHAQGYVERIVLEADASSFNWNDLHQHACTMSLFASKRLLDVRLPTGKPGKEGAQALQDFCQTATLDTILLVTCQDWGTKHGGKWSEAIDAMGKLVLASPIKPAEFPNWLTRRLSAKGIRADADALRILLSRVEGNLLAANQEVNKLAMQGVSGNIDASQMQQWVADSSRYDIFKVIDACYERDFSRAHKMLLGLKAEGEQVPGLVPMIGKELQNLAYYAHLQEKTGRAQAQMKTDYVWQSKQAQMLRMIDSGSSQTFENLVAQLARVDAISKGRASGDAWVSLARVLAQWCSSKTLGHVAICA